MKNNNSVPVILLLLIIVSVLAVVAVEKPSQEEISAEETDKATGVDVMQERLNQVLDQYACPPVSTPTPMSRTMTIDSEALGGFWRVLTPEMQVLTPEIKEEWDKKRTEPLEKAYEKWKSLTAEQKKEFLLRYQVLLIEAEFEFSGTWDSYPHGSKLVPLVNLLNEENRIADALEKRETKP